MAERLRSVGKWLKGEGKSPCTSFQEKEKVKGVEFKEKAEDVLYFGMGVIKAAKLANKVFKDDVHDPVCNGDFYTIRDYAILLNHDRDKQTEEEQIKKRKEIIKQFFQKAAEVGQISAISSQLAREVDVEEVVTKKWAAGSEEKFDEGVELAAQNLHLLNPGGKEELRMIKRMWMYNEVGMGIKRSFTRDWIWETNKEHEGKIKVFYEEAVKRGLAPAFKDDHGGVNYEKLDEAIKSFRT